MHVPRHVHVLSNFIWGETEAMLLVVNIVTCPIGTDCGGSAPVVCLYMYKLTPLKKKKKKKSLYWELHVELYIVEV